MTYEQTIEYLYSQLPMFSRIGAAAYNKDLFNITELCNALDNPQHKFKTIHIAGTNGKGSTSHMLAAILQEAGYKTGLYTSPHIKEFGERIRINGKMIDHDFVIDFTERTNVISTKVKPSFFELVVAMAFDYFALEKVDIAIIETGLGGRLDSTNIISPLLSVITNIGYDHMNLLGDTLPVIAFEKAGIIKRNTPVIIGETLEETKPVFAEKAAEMNAEIHYTEDQYDFSNAEIKGSYLNCTIKNKMSVTTEIIKIDLLGIYQVKNVCSVLNAVKILQQSGFTIPDTAVHNGLANTKKLTGLCGRWDLLQSNPAIILDVAHNEDGIKQLLLQLEKDYPTAEIHFVLGFVNDKDIDKMLSLLPKNASYYFTNAHIPRALPYELLKEKASLYDLKGKGFELVDAAIENAKMNASENDVIMVCGSFFIIAEVARDLNLM